MKRCLDTYLLVEIARGNPQAAKYIKNEFVITEQTLSEFYLAVLMEFDKVTAEHWCRKLNPFTQTTDQLTVMEAIDFKRTHHDKKIPLSDAIAYVHSQKNNLTLATANQDLKHFNEIEYNQL